MAKGKTRIILMLVAVCFALSALFFAILPVKSFADTASDTAAAQKSRNEKLIVKYALDDTSTGNGDSLTAYKWDSTAQAFVTDPNATATVQNSVGNLTGSVTSVSGIEGSAALSFTEKAHAQANFKLPADATGMTVSMWVKSSNTYWSSLVEFWDGKDGGRFGKGTMQGNGGRSNPNDPWSSNCPAHRFASIAEGGGWDSFIISANSSDNGGAAKDAMVAGRWYHVTYVLTANKLEAYRDGVLKQTFIDGITQPGQYEAAPSTILQSILKAVKGNNGKLGIRLGHDANNGDILDDFRIYNGAMSAAEVQALYGEYQGLSAIQGKTVKLDGINKDYTVDNGSNIRVETTAEAFPKILIGGTEAADVAYDDTTKTYSASGSGYSYSYTVGEYVEDERVATVTYRDTATGSGCVFTVTQIYKKVIKLASLQVKVNGVLQDIEGFDSDITEYKVVLSPDVYSFEFVAEASDGGSSDVDAVNESIAFNGDNVITTAGDGEAVHYKITLQRDRADTALPVLGGVQLGLTTQNIYVDELPSAVTESDLQIAYPNGSEVKDLTYHSATHAVTFKLADKVLGEETEYTVAYKTKQEGHLAKWSFESSVGTGLSANKVYRGARWDAAQNAYVENSALDMTVRGGGDNVAVTDKRTSVAAKQVAGVMGNGIELAAWDYTTAKLPAVEGGTTGFTFSTWMKTSGIVWEAIFTVLGDGYGTILEKGHMQRHTVTNGQPITGWEHLSNSTGAWTKSMDDAKKAEFFNTSANGAAYVLYTVTVTYANGVGTIKFYKDGELAVVYEDDEGGTDKAQIIIEAMNAGASVGLHRHHYDGGQASRFDETNIYAYAMTASEVKATYDSIAELLAASPEYYDVTGLGYPEEILLSGATSVASGENGTKTGVTDSGVSYSYTPLTVAATPENDEKGIEVIFGKNGKVRTATVKFRRTLNLRAESLGYQIGNGAVVPISVPENPGDDILVKVAAGTNLTEVKAGNIAVKTFAEDDNTEHYKTQFTYSASTQTATVRISYVVYEGLDTVYTIRFITKSTDTFDHISVTGGKTDLQLTQKDFTANTARVAVSDLGSFTLNVSVSLAEGARLEGGGNTLTFTKSNLADGKLSITVINENGDSTVYFLVPVAPSSVATLSALSAGSYELGFAADKTTYTLMADKGESEAIFAATDATASADGAVVKKIFDKTSNSIIVTVTAADGVTVQKYVIEIKERDTDATLSKIEVGGTALADFDPQKSEYTVKYTGDMPAVTAAAASSTAETPSVSAAENGKVTITVTAENGAKKEYTVTLVKKSSDAALKKLTLNGSEITFAGNTAEYSAPAGTRLKGIAVSAEAAEGASAAYRLDQAENKIIVTVTAEDGTAATYTVAVSIASGETTEGGVTEDNSPKPSGVSPVVLGVSIAAGVLVLAAVAVGVWFIVRKKKRVELNSEDGGEE